MQERGLAFGSTVRSDKTLQDISIGTMVVEKDNTDGGEPRGP